MKQRFYHAVIVLTIMSALLASCSKKDNLPAPQKPSEPLLTQITELEDADAWQKFTYDNKGRLTEIAYKNYKVAYIYNGSAIEMKLYKPGDAEPYGIYTGELNPNGTLKVLSGSRKSGKSIYFSTYTFTYDADNQLVQSKEEYRYDNAEPRVRIHDLIWKDGNCIKTILTDGGKVQHTEYVEFDLSKKNRLRLNGHAFTEWTDAFLLGKPNKNAKSAEVWQQPDGTKQLHQQFIWTYNEKDLPLQCQLKNLIKGSFYTELYQFKQ